MQPDFTISATASDNKDVKTFQQTEKTFIVSKLNPFVEYIFTVISTNGAYAMGAERTCPECKLLNILIVVFNYSTRFNLAKLVKFVLWL